MGILPAHGLLEVPLGIHLHVCASICLSKSTRRLFVNARFLQRDDIRLGFLFLKVDFLFLLLISIKGEELLGFSICLSLVMLLCFLFAFLSASHSKNKLVSFVSFHSSTPFSCMCRMP